MAAGAVGTSRILLEHGCWSIWFVGWVGFGPFLCLLIGLQPWTREEAGEEAGMGCGTSGCEGTGLLGTLRQSVRRMGM